MAKPLKERVSRSESRRRQRGEVKYSNWIPDTVEARARMKALADQLCAESRAQRLEDDPHAS